LVRRATRRREGERGACLPAAGVTQSGGWSYAPKWFQGQKAFAGEPFEKVFRSAVVCFSFRARRWWGGMAPGGEVVGSLPCDVGGGREQRRRGTSVCADGILRGHTGRYASG